jgi:hypothetical protein
MISGTRYPVRDRGSIECECGEQIISWNGTTDYGKSFIRKGDPKDAAKNAKFD